MRALYYECFSGISGDMHIGAMLDLGVPADYLRSELAKLSVANEFELVVARDKRLGISGTRATVKLAPDSARPHRHLRHVREIIQSANYADAVSTRALNIFAHIAEAEARIHDISVDKVHFHEVGATDSIVDIVAAAICFDYLQVDKVFCGEVEVGGGMVRCEHGLMPVPAPATAAILTGVPCHYGRVDSEATTPTGAAILRELVDEFAPPTRFTQQQQGYGVGQKEFSIPNILRVTLGELTGQDNARGLGFYQQETNTELQCNIDDMPAEAFQALLDALFDLPVLDAWITAVQMKKQRPGHKLSVLLQTEQLENVLRCVFEHSTTLGVRTSEVRKWMLPRAEHQLSTSLGDVRVKVAQTETGELRWKVEHDDLLSLRSDAISYMATSERLRSEIAAQIKSLPPILPKG